MPRKKRNYKAEYARRKSLAISRGYTGPRQEYKARKALGLTRGFPSLRFDELPDFAIDSISGARIKRMRREAQEWSNKHSWVPASHYDPRMTNERLEDYWRAYVQPHSQLGPSRRKRAKERRIRIYNYMVKYNFPVIGTPEDWKSPIQTTEVAS